LIRTLTQVEHVRKRCLDFPGRPASQYKGYLEPASVEHPNTPSAPDAVDITVVCSRLAVTLHFTRHPLAYRSRAASAARVCWPSTRVSRLVSVYPRHKQLPPLAWTIIDQGYIVGSFAAILDLTLGKLAAVEKLSIP
jgi:hypothetical protein